MFLDILTTAPARHFHIISPGELILIPLSLDISPPPLLLLEARNNDLVISIKYLMHRR